MLTSSADYPVSGFVKGIPAKPHSAKVPIDRRIDCSQSPVTVSRECPKSSPQDDFVTNVTIGPIE